MSYDMTTSPMCTYLSDHVVYRLTYLSGAKDCAEPFVGVNGAPRYSCSGKQRIQILR